MKLFIQIPCLNESEHLGETLRDLPREIPGVDSIEVLIIDDGSTDGTAACARELGVHHIVRFPRNRGLAAAHMAGLSACFRLGADVVVNTDADNQYPGSAIADLIRPIVEGRADLVVGDRQTDRVGHFSWIKRLLQRYGSKVVRVVSRTSVADATSGFRAFGRNALERLYVHNRFTYTLETVIQAGMHGLALENVTVVTNAKRRESRLFKSIAEYVRRNGTVILRACHMYSPIRTFAWIAAVFLAVGVALGLRFAYYYATTIGPSGHVQSLLVGVGSLVLSVLVGTTMLLGELVASNRRLIEEVLVRARRVERALAMATGDATRALRGDVMTTDAAPWAAEVVPMPRESSLRLRSGEGRVRADRTG